MDAVLTQYGPTSGDFSSFSWRPLSVPMVSLASQSFNTLGSLAASSNKRPGKSRRPHCWSAAAVLPGSGPVPSRRHISTRRRGIRPAQSRGPWPRRYPPGRSTIFSSSMANTSATIRNISRETICPRSTPPSAGCRRRTAATACSVNSCTGRMVTRFIAVHAGPGLLTEVPSLDQLPGNRREAAMVWKSAAGWPASSPGYQVPTCRSIEGGPSRSRSQPWPDRSRRGLPLPPAARKPPQDKE